MVDKLRELHRDLDQGIVPETGYANYTVRQAAEDWLAMGSMAARPRRSRRTRMCLSRSECYRRPEASRTDRCGRTAGVVEDGCRVLQRGRHHGSPGAEARHPARGSQRSCGPQCRRLVDTPKGQEGRPSKSLTLEQAVAVITAAKTLPTVELHPGLKDVRRPAELMYAYIVLSLLVGVRTEEARALRWDHVDLRGDPDAKPTVPPHVAVWRSVRVHGETKTERSRRTLGLPQMAVEALGALLESQAHERAMAGERWQDSGWCSPPISAPPSTQGTSGKCSSEYAAWQASVTAGRRASYGPHLSA